VVVRLLGGTALVSLLLVPPELAAQVPSDSGRIVGHLVDAVTLAPVAAAEVKLVTSLIETPVRDVTDDEGRFVFPSVRPGSCKLEIEQLAYGTQWTTVDVPRGETIDVEVQVAPQPVLLEPLKVEVYPRSLRLEREGFYRRRDTGFGYVFGPAELGHWRGSLTQNLQMVPGVYRSIGDVPKIKMLFPGAYKLSWCVPTIFVNGWPDPVAIESLDAYQPSMLEGVEVYRTWWDIPGKYKILLYPSRLDCGVVLLWLRGEG
jgi:hypothetical protein